MANDTAMTGNILQEFPVIDWSAVLEPLVEKRRVILPVALPAFCWEGLQQEAQQYRQQNDFQQAKIGRAQSMQQRSDVRSDQLHWLSEKGEWETAYLRWMQGLQQCLNRELFLGINEFEAHYAYYPVGAFYKTHVDRHHDKDARVVSAVLYLNKHWQADEGGELVIYDAEECVVEKELPTGGKLAIFMSDDVPHEVLPANRERWSIAGWFRR